MVERAPAAPAPQRHCSEGSLSDTYHVPAISCGHCKQTIETGLADLDGVSTVTVDIEAKSVDVAGTAATESVRRRLDDLGYPAADEACRSRL